MSNRRDAIKLKKLYGEDFYFNQPPSEEVYNQALKDVEICFPMINDENIPEKVNQGNEIVLDKIWEALHILGQTQKVNVQRNAVLVISIYHMHQNHQI